MNLWKFTELGDQVQGWAFGAGVRLAPGAACTSDRSPHWGPVCFAFQSSSLLVHILGGLRWRLGYLGPCHLRGGSRRNSRLYLGSEPSSGSSVSAFPIKVKIYKCYFERKAYLSTNNVKSMCMRGLQKVHKMHMMRKLCMDFKILAPK